MTKRRASAIFLPGTKSTLLTPPRTPVDLSYRMGTLYKSYYDPKGSGIKYTELPNSTYVSLDGDDHELVAVKNSSILPISTEIDNELIALRLSADKSPEKYRSRLEELQSQDRQVRPTLLHVMKVMEVMEEEARRARATKKGGRRRKSSAVTVRRQVRSRYAKKQNRAKKRRATKRRKPHTGKKAIQSSLL